MYCLQAVTSSPLAVEFRGYTLKLGKIVSARNPYPVLAGLEVVVVEAEVALEQGRLDALRGLDRHLRPVLKNEDGELGTRHARQPQAEILVHLCTAAATRGGFNMNKQNA